MSSRLDGPRTKIERAKKHLGDLDRELRVLPKSDPYRVSVEPEPDPRERVIRLRTEFDFTPPLRWGAIAGDAIHNIRSALDLLVYQLLLARNKTPDIWTEFPIFLDPDKYAGKGKRKVKGAAKGAVDIIDELQPCSETGNPESHPLWLLHCLDIRDKHRLLNVVVAAAQTQHFEIDTGGAFNITSSTYSMFVSPVEDGTELGRFTLTDPDAVVDVECHIAFQIVFEDFGLGDDLLVIGTVKRIGEFVEDAIKRFEPFLT